MKKFLFILLVIAFAACSQKPQQQEEPARVGAEPEKSSVEEMELKGKVKFMIISIDHMLHPDDFFSDWTETYHLMYINEQQGVTPGEFMLPEENEAVADAGDWEFLVDEDGEVILPDSYLEDEEEDFEGESDMGLYERYDTGYDSHPLQHFRFDEKGDITELLFFSEDAEDKPMKTIRRYNDDHHKLLEQVYDDNGEILSSYKFQYDSLGYVISSEDFSTGFNNGEVSRHQMTYNDNHQLLSDITTVLGKETAKREYRYDENGNCIYNRWEGRGFINHYETEYNQLNQRVKETKFQSDGKVEMIHLFDYDNKGNNILETVVGYVQKPEGDTLQTFVYEYDNRGNRTKEMQYYKGHLDFIDEVEYDSHNREVAHHTVYNGTSDYEEKEEYWSNYKYDSRGNITESVEKNSNNNVRTRVVYTYKDGVLKEQRTYKTSALEENFCGKGKAPERLVERIVYTNDEQGNWVKKEYFNTVKRQEDFSSAKGETRENYEEMLTGRMTRHIEYY